MSTLTGGTRCAVTDAQLLSSGVRQTASISISKRRACVELAIEVITFIWVGFMLHCFVRGAELIAHATL
jgi:hypothetical protein